VKRRPGGRGTFFFFLLPVPHAVEELAFVLVKVFCLYLPSLFSLGW